MSQICFKKNFRSSTSKRETKAIKHFLRDVWKSQRRMRINKVREALKIAPFVIFTILRKNLNLVQEFFCAVEVATGFDEMMNTCCPGDERKKKTFWSSSILFYCFYHSLSEKSLSRDKLHFDVVSFNWLNTYKHL